MRVLDLSRGLFWMLIGVELAALALIVAVIVVDRSTVGSDALWCAALIALGVLHTEVVRRIDYLDVRLLGEHHVTLTSTWAFAGAMVLPPTIAWVAVTVIYIHLWFCVGRADAILIYRHVFTTASMVLAAFAAHAVAISVNTALGAGPLGVLGVVLAMFAFTLVNAGLVALAIVLSAPHPTLTMMIGSWNDNLLEICTLCLGALVAVGFATSPVLVLFVVPPLLVLHRSARAHQLAEAAATDGKTGLLNAAAWHNRAEARLTDRRGTERGLLVLDLDHFKRVNDTYGHLVGDDVLAAVATAISGEVRDRDLVGRFGGEEFVVLLSLPGAGGAVEMNAVAERIRLAVASLTLEVSTADGPLTVAGVTVSIGAALATDTGRWHLHDLLQAADAALYAAKRGGRNQVCLAGALAGAPVLDPMRAGRPERVLNVTE